MLPTAPPQPHAHLLSFDGGGIRGLFALQFAEHIETLLRDRSGNPDLALVGHFHYIGDTSTDAIIAATLSWGLPVDQVIRVYREHGRIMFTRAGTAPGGLRDYPCSAKFQPAGGHKRNARHAPALAT